MIFNTPGNCKMEVEGASFFSCGGLPLGIITSMLHTTPDMEISAVNNTRYLQHRLLAVLDVSFLQEITENTDYAGFFVSWYFCVIQNL